MKVRNKFGDCGTKKTLVGLGWQASFLLRLLCRRNRRRASAEKKKKNSSRPAPVYTISTLCAPQTRREGKHACAFRFIHRSVGLIQSLFFLVVNASLFSLSCTTTREREREREREEETRMRKCIFFHRWLLRGVQIQLPIQHPHIETPRPEKKNGKEEALVSEIANPSVNSPAL